MEERLVFHVDVNSAFLSWSALEELKAHPGSVDLRTIPSAVGGDVKTRHGVITAKSIPAKKYGVTTGEPVVKALQKCPHLVLVPSDFAAYRRYSHALMQILAEYTPALEQASIDEAYLDMTGTAARFGFAGITKVHSPKEGFAQGETPGGTHGTAAGALPDATQGTATGVFPEASPADTFPLAVAAAIRDRVYRELGFTVNVGIGENKLLAKTASDFRKPGRIHTLWREEIPDKLWPMPVGDLYGCGRKTAEKLRQLGILTVGDAADFDEGILCSYLGEKAGQYLHESSNGRSDAPIRAAREDVQSYSNETTTSFDITASNYHTASAKIVRELSAHVSRRLARDGVYAGTIDVSVKTDDFRRLSRQTKLPHSTNDAAVIRKTATLLLDQLTAEIFAGGHTVRLIGVGGSNLDRGEYQQMDLFTLMEHGKEEQAAAERKRKLDAMLKSADRKFGEGTIRTGADAFDGM